MMTLHPAIGKNRWCGPAAFAIITGKDTDFAARELRALTNRRYIRGCSVTALVQAIQGQGYETKQVSESKWALKSQANKRPRVEHWVRSVMPAVYLVASSSHFMVIDTRTGEACDNHTVYPKPLEKYRFRRAKVQYAFRISLASGIVSLQKLGSAQKTVEELQELLTLP